MESTISRWRHRKKRDSVLWNFVTRKGRERRGVNVFWLLNFSYEMFDVIGYEDS